MKNMSNTKEEQKQHLIDIMRGDEELGLYDNNTEIGMHTLTDTTTGCNISRFGKQETLEEFKKRFANNKSNKDIKLDYQDGIYYGIEVGANWQAKRMYSDMQEYAEFCIRCYIEGMPVLCAIDWFNQLNKSK